MNRRIHQAVLTFGCLALGFSASGTQAADRVKLEETDRFILSKTTFHPGEPPQAMHLPPPGGQIVTLVTPSEIQLITEVDGVRHVDKGKFEPGMVWYIAPTTMHSTTNIGKEPMTLVIVTLKPALK